MTRYTDPRQNSGKRMSKTKLPGSENQKGKWNDDIRQNSGKCMSKTKLLGSEIQ